MGGRGRNFEVGWVEFACLELSLERDLDGTFDDCDVCFL